MIHNCGDNTLIYCGIDVGKSFHHGVIIDSSGKKIHSQKFIQDESQIRALLNEALQHGTAVVVVDQPRSVGSLVVNVCLDMNITLLYIPSLVMRRYADMHPGNAKTDARDALMIALAAKNLPEVTRKVRWDESSLADMRMLSGFDDDLAKENTALVNRLRGVLSDIHPGLEKALAPHCDQKIVVELLAYYGGPQGLAAADPHDLQEFISQHAPRAYRKIWKKIMEALERQTVIIPGTAASEQVLRFTAQQLKSIREQRAILEQQFEVFLVDNPLGEIIVSMPGIGTKLGMKILTDIGDIGDFPSGRHLASYCGLSPRTHRSGTSIKGEYAQHAGNKRLKNSMFRAAFASLSDPRSRTYYQRKRSEGKTHNTALISLARQRCTALHKMLTTNTLYQHKQTTTPQTA